MMMKAIQVGELKSHFSEILQQIQTSGEQYIIEYGKKHHKVAMLVPYDKSYERAQERKFGICKNRGSFTLNDTFEISEEEFLGL